MIRLNRDLRMKVTIHVHRSSIVYGGCEIDGESLVG